jgi:hypothetical protein
MTISSSTSRIQYTSTGQTIFSYPFKIYDDTDISVSVINASGDDVTDSYSYTVSGAGDSNGGDVTFGTTVTSGFIVTLYRDEPFTQEINYTEGDDFPSASHEEGLDRSLFRDQTLKNIIDRSFKFEEGGDYSSISLEINIEDYKGFALGFNSSTGALEPTSVGDGSTSSVTATGTTTSRSLANRFGDALNLKDFGAVGDYDTDDTAAIVAWLAACSTLNKSGYAPSGVYRIVDTSIELPDQIKIFGDGAPSIYTFPQNRGDKSLLRPDYKDQISGTVFIFDGTASGTYTTVRSDDYSSFSYCLKYSHQTGLVLKNLGIILDCDVLDSGGTLTAAASDNRSDYDAGLVLQGGWCTLDNVNIFGYFDNAGLVIHNEDDDSLSDPDYNNFVNCDFTSVAIIGHDTDAGAASNGGLTGQRFTNTGIYSAADHHTRLDGDYTIPALYCDHYLDSSENGHRGVKLTACNIRTYANVGISLDHTTDFSAVNTIWEFPSLSGGDSNSDDSGKIVGTANTGNITLIGGAENTDLGIYDLCTTIAGKVISIDNGAFENILVSDGAAIVRLAPQGSVGDPMIQLVNAGDYVTDSVNNGWQIRYDHSDSDNLLKLSWENSQMFSLTNSGTITSAERVTGRLNFGASEVLTISSGEITLTDGLGNFRISTESSASTDDLDTINGGSEGDVVFIRATNSSNTIVLKDSTGNIRTNGSVDLSLDNSQDLVMLVFDGTNWRAILWDIGS